MSILDTNLDTTPVSRRKMSNGKYQYSIRIPGRTSSKYALLAPSLDAFPAPPTAAMQAGKSAVRVPERSSSKHALLTSRSSESDEKFVKPQRQIILQ